MDGKYIMDSSNRLSANEISAELIDNSLWHNFDWLVDQKEKQGKYLQGYDLSEGLLDQVLSNWEQTKTNLSSVSYATCCRYDKNEIISKIRQILDNLNIKSEIELANSVFIKVGLIEGRYWEEHVTTSPIFLEALIDIIIDINPNVILKIGDGSGHERDTSTLLNVSGINHIINKYPKKISFFDLNFDDITPINIPNPLSLSQIMIPKSIITSDFVISLAKLKTHHWTGVSLSLKNLFGLLPGSVYGYPKNRLHWASYPRVISDIASAIKPKLNIIDGIIGIEGNGPLNGEPINSNIIIGGLDPLLTDTFATQIMGMSAALIPSFWYAKLKEVGNWYPLLNPLEFDFIRPFKSPPNWPWLYSSAFLPISNQISIAKCMLI